MPQDKATQNKKVGIVIPIYNVAKYLRKCLDSVVNQTHKDFYVALVNDGSTDIENLKIALEYVEKDPRFLIFDKINYGQSSARNVGIDYFSNKLKIAKSAVRGGAESRI